jgi:hypothetical protein
MPLHLSLLLLLLLLMMMMMMMMMLVSVLLEEYDRPYKQKFQSLSATFKGK